MVARCWRRKPFGTSSLAPISTSSIGVPIVSKDCRRKFACLLSHAGRKRTRDVPSELITLWAPAAEGRPLSSRTYARPRSAERRRLGQLDVLQRQRPHRPADRGVDGVEDGWRDDADRRLADAAPEIVRR